MRRHEALMSTLTLALAISFGLIDTVSAQQAPDPRVADLVQTGRVRAGVGLAAAHWASKDSATGELRGVAVDLARALGARLGVEVVLVEYPSPPRVLDGVKNGAWDVGFIGVDPARAVVVDFSSPYLQIDANYLVPTGSSIRNSADVDQPGVRIAVSRNSVEDFVLSKMLKRAKLVRLETVSAGFDALRAENAEVLAAPRPGLFQSLARLPGSRLLEDRFHATFAAIAVPKGQAGRLAYISDFIEEAKASGLVQRAIERAGLRGVVQVAPAGNPSTR
jgi:polar amino acid transport system substrate-binding protein